MKKIIYILTIGVAALWSCSALDQEPATSVSTTTAITSVADVEYAVNGAYYLATGSDQMTLFGELSIYADELGPDSEVLQGSGQYAQKIHERSITSVDSYNPYYYLYKAIANINKTIEVAKTFEEQEEVAPYIAELYGLRGLLHFHLATLYAPIPTSGSSNTMGIVLSTEVYGLDYIGERSSLDETYQQIVNDFTAAMNSGITKEVTDGHVNYWAALALRARAYLYWGKYAEALADAKAVISGSPYTLYTIDNYTSQWSSDNPSEMIMEYVTTDTENAQRYAPGYYTSPDGYNEYGVPEAFIEFLNENPNDVRSKMAGWREPTSGSGTAGYYPLKYPGKTGAATPTYNNNIKVCRLSEMYLIAAEAALKTVTDNGATAAGFLNTLRKNRITGYQDVTTTDIDDILNERRKELFAEGQIAFDLWRNGKTISTGARTFEPGNTYNVLPIPKDEIDVSAGKLKQNPGY